MLPSSTLLEALEFFDAQTAEIKGGEQEWNGTVTYTVQGKDEDNDHYDNQYMMIQFHLLTSFTLSSLLYVERTGKIHCS